MNRRELAGLGCDVLELGSTSWVTISCPCASFPLCVLSFPGLFKLHVIWSRDFWQCLNTTLPRKQRFVLLTVSTTVSGTQKAEPGTAAARARGCASLAPSLCSAGVSVPSLPSICIAFPLDIS